METDETRKSERLQELQERFQALEPEIKDSDTKKAISILNGMLQEIWRHVNTNQPDGQYGGGSFNDILNLYQNAPKMEGQSINAPLPDGTPAPDFSLKDVDNNTVELSAFRGSTVLLVFYPLDWSPGCSQQLDLYQNELKEFEKRGIKVVGISVDSIYSHGAWSAVRKITFPLLSDFNPKAAVARKYNAYRETDGFNERALYIIDGAGIIRYGLISPYLHHVPDVYELFRKLDEMRISERGKL